MRRTPTTSTVTEDFRQAGWGHGGVSKACLYIAPLLCALLGACAPETESRHYDTYALLEQDRAIDRDWLPEWLPQQATAIDEMHNIDTNAHMWAVTVPVGIELNLPATCASTTRAKLTKLPFEPRWWPEPSAGPAGSEGSGFIYFSCDGEQVGLAQEGGRLFGWRADEGAPLMALRLTRSNAKLQSSPAASQIQRPHTSGEHRHGAGRV